jgi:hypothetical protein
VVLLALVSACGFHVSGSASDDTSAPGDSAIAPADIAPIDAPPDAPPPPRTLDPATDWEISADGGATWAAIALPSFNWGCDNCTRLFRTTIEGIPASARFEFASDNKARLLVNGAVAYDEFWITGYCTDQPCCARCCDNEANCANNLSAEKSLDATGLALFTAGTNVVVWEAFQETGGSGFTTTMTVTYSPQLSRGR